MSSGRVHTRASLMLSGGFLLGTFYTQSLSDVWYAVGALLGVMLTPDLDVDAGFSADRYIRKGLGGWAEMLWDGIWGMYRRSLKHGGELSHFPVVGTLGRIIYLLFWFVFLPEFVLCWSLELNLWQEVSWWGWRIAEHWKIIVGLMGADTIHYFLDILTTEHAKHK